MSEHTPTETAPQYTVNGSYLYHDGRAALCAFASPYVPLLQHTADLLNSHTASLARIAELEAALKALLDSYEGDMKVCGYGQDAIDGAEAICQARAALRSTSS